MNKVKITVMKVACYKDLIERFENNIEHSCDMVVGKEFIVEDLNKPIGLCDSAWETLYPFIKDLMEGKGNFFDGWMKNEMSAMISCNDGFRPVSFYLEIVK